MPLVLNVVQHAGLTADNLVTGLLLLCLRALQAHVGSHALLFTVALGDEHIHLQIIRCDHFLHQFIHLVHLFLTKLLQVETVWVEAIGVRQQRVYHVGVAGVAPETEIREGKGQRVSGLLVVQRHMPFDVSAAVNLPAFEAEPDLPAGAAREAGRIYCLFHVNKVF